MLLKPTPHAPGQDPGSQFGLTRRAFMARIGQSARQTAGWTIGGRLAPLGLGGLGVGGLGGLLAARAARAELPPLTPELAGYLAEAQLFLDELQGARIEFRQLNPDGSAQVGLIWLDRIKRRMKLTYQDPQIGLVLLADQNKLEQLNTRLETFQDYPIGYTPAHFLLAPFRFQEPSLTYHWVRAEPARTDTGDEVTILRVHLTEEDYISQGSLELFFKVEPAPVFLFQWRVYNAAGQTIIVDLTQLETGDYSELTREFEYREPWYLNKKR